MIMKLIYLLIKMHKKRNEIKCSSFDELATLISRQRIATCRFCGRKIEFIPDTQRKGFDVPVNYDDREIHFNSCKKNE